MEFPEKLGECIDLLKEFRDEIKSLTADYNTAKAILDAKEKALEEHIYGLFGNHGIDGAKGTFATATLKRTIMPNVKDWEAFQKYIIENNALDMLHRRVTVTAYRERRDAGVEIPGVEDREQFDILLNAR